jgi:hypothetical protein
MGNCMSNHTPFSNSLETLVDPDIPSSSILCPTTTHIIVHRAGELYGHLPGQSPPPNLWLFEYRLNLGPVCIGQHVVLHLRAEDYGICKESMWTPPGLLVDSTRTPCGLHQDSLWTPHGLHLECMEYMRSPQGVQVESTWSPGGIYGIYRESTGSPQLPVGECNLQ